MKLSQTELECAFEHGFSPKSRTIIISGAIDENTFRKVAMAMTQLESINAQPITVDINSEGGDIYEALAIVGRLRSSKCHIITRGFGGVMSAASLILVCGDKRLMSRYAYFMHHEAGGEVDGRLSDVSNMVEQWQREEDDWSQVMEDFTGVKAEVWLKAGKKDTYLSATKCKELGIVDELI